jgi:hypothetical protein
MADRGGNREEGQGGRDGAGTATACVLDRDRGLSNERAWYEKPVTQYTCTLDSNRKSVSHAGRQAACAASLRT